MLASSGFGGCDVFEAQPAKNESDNVVAATVESRFIRSLFILQAMIVTVRVLMRELNRQCAQNIRLICYGL